MRALAAVCGCVCGGGNVNVKCNIAMEEIKCDDDDGEANGAARYWAKKWRARDQTQCGEDEGATVYMNVKVECDMWYCSNKNRTHR